MSGVDIVLDLPEGFARLANDAISLADKSGLVLVSPGKRGTLIRVLLAAAQVLANRAGGAPLDTMDGSSLLVMPSAGAPGTSSALLSAAIDAGATVAAYAGAKPPTRSIRIVEAESDPAPPPAEGFADRAAIARIYGVREVILRSLPAEIQAGTVGAYRAGMALGAGSEPLARALQSLGRACAIYRDRVIGGVFSDKLTADEAREIERAAQRVRGARDSAASAGVTYGGATSPGSPGGPGKPGGGTTIDVHPETKIDAGNLAPWLILAAAGALLFIEGSKP